VPRLAPGEAMNTSKHEITLMLRQWGSGDREGSDKLMAAIYTELHRLAARRMRRESPGNTLQTTAVVHETYLRLIDQRQRDWKNRAHFFAIAAQLMRRVLIDHARNRRAAKRGDGLKISLDQVELAGEKNNLDVLAVDEALQKLAAVDPQQARIVELRFFGGLSVEETAQAAKISPATVKRDWSMAKAWLHREISRAASH